MKQKFLQLLNKNINAYRQRINVLVRSIKEVVDEHLQCAGVSVLFLLLHMLPDLPRLAERALKMMHLCLR